MVHGDTKVMKPEISVELVRASSGGSRQLVCDTQDIAPPYAVWRSPSDPKRHAPTDWISDDISKRSLVVLSFAVRATVAHIVIATSRTTTSGTNLSILSRVDKQFEGLVLRRIHIKRRKSADYL